MRPSARPLLPSVITAVVLGSVRWAIALRRRLRLETTVEQLITTTPRGFLLPKVFEGFLFERLLTG
jgi:hypothetical protein